MQNPQQKMIMNIMPVFFSAICYNFASGLNLYILVSTVLGIAQNKLVRVGEVKLPEKKPLQKKKNMYAAAQARKKRVTKELKAAKKRNGPTPKGTRPADTKGTPKE
jgi:membrane protein insertase Oxa1/YidC/SpoIIIJ